MSWDIQHIFLARYSGGEVTLSWLVLRGVWIKLQQYGEDTDQSSVLNGVVLYFTIYIVPV